MSKQVYVVCEKNVAGDIGRHQLAEVLQERDIEYTLLPVSQRRALNKPAISSELFDRIAWLCFSTPDAVRLFFTFFSDFQASNLKFSAQDLNTAAALLQQGIKTDYIPVKPLYLRQNSIFEKQGELVAAVDGQEWVGLQAAINMVFTERVDLPFSIPEKTKAIFLLNTPREAEYFLRVARNDGVFLCKNPAAAEVCWQYGAKVILPTDFTYEGMLTELQEIIHC
ncbi:MAG: uroporphyrinogen-III synthase [Acidaminococcaceae bacterium]